MADPEHIKVFHRGATAWNRWRHRHHGVEPDLSHADLRHASLRQANLNNANLRFANLEGANLGRAYLESADLEGSRPRGAHLFEADLGRADLRGADLKDAQIWRARLEDADLEGATLEAADLRFADLSHAHLHDVILKRANLSGTSLVRSDLRGADLSEVCFEGTRLVSTRLGGATFARAEMARASLDHLDLSRVRGLAEVRHLEPSSIGVDTLERTAAGLSRDGALREEVEIFLRRAGVGESFIELFRRRIERPFDFHPTFIRYSQADRTFAEKLYDGLQENGVRCWLQEHPMLAGDDIHELLVVDPWDRVVLCGSEAAFTSWWIDHELAHAFARETEIAAENVEEHVEEHGREHTETAKMLLPVSLDGYLAAPSENGTAKKIRERLTADFEGWDKDTTTFDRGLEQLVEALRAA